MPQASAMPGRLAFPARAPLATDGLQPLLGTGAGGLRVRGAFGLAVPAIVVAALVFGAGKLFDRGDVVQPPWYSAWILFPGAFLLAGAATMCIVGALVEDRKSVV